MDRNVRDYEVSIWTLQDEFITILKHSKTENKGRIQDPDFDLKDDGTLTFTFSLPMYLNENDIKKENPIWFNARNGNIIADLRKVKVIFNKGTNDEAVFEFLITKVTEKHEGFELICEVETEGLAFYELGKIGYKISLNEDTFLDDWNYWFDNDGISENEPKATIKYWTDKVLENTNWSCDVQMDWTGYTSRNPKKVYEDAFAADWKVENDVLMPTSMEAEKEKERLIEVEESNIYNITQTIAETFGVHCRYEYEHDGDYHIIGRKVVYYNNFIKEQEGELDINYAYNTEEISREIDSKDTVTKMFVKTLQDSNTESGLATIMDTTANKSGEDYLLNFDYLYAIGNITQEQYDEVSKYEARMHQFNEDLKLIENQLAALDDQLIDAKAEVAVAKNSISLDHERISATNDLLNALTDNTGTISVTENRPDTCVVIQDGNTYYINVRQKGVIASSIRIYKEYNSGQASGNKLNNLIYSWKIEYDEFNNIIKIKFLSNPVVNILYLIYDYSPQLYYDNIRKVWESRLAKDQNNYEVQSKLIKDLNKKIYGDEEDETDNGLIGQQNEIIDNKKIAIQNFERLMGPAIREGYWQPEDEYAKYGERHNVNLTLNDAAIFDNNLASIGWDDILFDDEQDNKYKISIESNDEYYYFVDLRGHLDLFTQYKDNLEQLSFIYQDISAPIRSEDNLLYLHFLPIGSQSQLVFMKTNENNSLSIVPALLLTGLKNVNINTIKLDSCRIGILTTNINADVITTTNITTIFDSTMNNNRSIITTGNNTYQVIYPRIRIDSSVLKNTEDKLNIKMNNPETLEDENIILSNYEDYYILSREDIEDNVSHFRNYITFKPELIFKLGTYPTFNIHYELANTGLMIYLDAKQVLRENAYPKVSYSIKPTLMDENFTRTAYKYLNHIAHINDYELKFENVQGYISELHLMLDFPKDDDIKIENYKTKFEDLFSSIVVQTEQMKKNSAIIGMAASAFTNAGELQGNLVQSVMNHVDLNYAFNNGTLTINEEDGIWGTSDSGVVAFRGGGIFTATQKDANDNWIWNTGILPGGINADLITTGQLDTNLVRVFAGDDLKLVLKGDGLFAYRSQWSNDNGTIAANERSDGLDLGQYVVHNGDGLFLRAEKGTSGAKIKFNFNCYNGILTIAQVQPENNDNVTTNWDYPDGRLIAYKTEFHSYEEHYFENEWKWKDVTDVNIRQVVNYIMDFFSNRFKNKNVIYWFTNKTDSTFVNDYIKNNYLVTNHNWQDYNILINYNTKEIIAYSYNENNELQEEYISYGTLTQNIDRVAISWDGLTLRNWNNEKVFYADADTGNLTVEGTIRAKELLIIDEDSDSSPTNIDTYVQNFISGLPTAANITYIQGNEPESGMHSGDLWIDSDDNNKLCVYNGEYWVWLGTYDYNLINSVKNAYIEYYASYEPIPTDVDIEWKEYAEWKNTVTTTKYHNIWIRERYIDNDGNSTCSNPVLIQQSPLPGIGLTANHRIYYKYLQHSYDQQDFFSYDIMEERADASLITLTAVPQNASITNWQYRVSPINGGYGYWTTIPSSWYYNNFYQEGKGRIITLDLNQIINESALNGVSYYGQNYQLLEFRVNTNVYNVYQFISIFLIDRNRFDSQNWASVVINNQCNAPVYYVNNKLLSNQQLIQNIIGYEITKGQNGYAINTHGTIGASNNDVMGYMSRFWTWSNPSDIHYAALNQGDNAYTTNFDSQMLSYNNNTDAWNWEPITDIMRPNNQIAPAYHLIKIKEDIQTPVTIETIITRHDENNQIDEQWILRGGILDLLRVDFDDSDPQIDFSITGYANAQVTINKGVGIKVTDNNQNYFQTTATQMGFWRYDGIDSITQEPTFTQQLGFTDGNLFVKNGALIGGWTTTNNSLYSGSASTLDANNGIYLGTDGLSVSGNNYKAHFNTSDFMVNIGDDNTALQIDESGAIMKNLIVTEKLVAPNLNANIYAGPYAIYIGNDSTDNYTSLDQCAEVLNNKILSQDVTIYIRAGYQTQNIHVSFSGIQGSGNIIIQPLTNDGTILSIGQNIRIMNCTTIIFKNISFWDTCHDTLINISGTRMVSFFNCKFVGIITTGYITPQLISIDYASTVLIDNGFFQLGKIYIRVYPGSSIILLNSTFRVFKVTENSQVTWAGTLSNTNNWRSFILNGANIKIKRKDNVNYSTQNTERSDWTMDYSEYGTYFVKDIDAYYIYTESDYQYSVDNFYTQVVASYYGDDSTESNETENINNLPIQSITILPSNKSVAYIRDNKWTNNSNTGWDNTSILSMGYVYNSFNNHHFGNIGCVWFDWPNSLSGSTIIGGTLIFTRKKDAGKRNNAVIRLRVIRLTTTNNFSYDSGFENLIQDTDPISWSEQVNIPLTGAFVSALQTNNYALAFTTDDESYDINSNTYSANYSKIDASTITLNVTYK